MQVGDLITFGTAPACRTGIIVSKWESERLVEMENDAQWMNSWTIEVLWHSGELETYDEDDFEFFEVMNGN